MCLELVNTIVCGECGGVVGKVGCGGVVFVLVHKPSLVLSLGQAEQY